MLVKDLILTQPDYCLIDDYLLKPAQMLAANDLKCVPVVESLAHKNLIGVVSDREICRQAIAEGLNPSTTTVGRVMNSSFFTVNGECHVDECLEILKSNNAAYLFVIDENNSCIGLITAEDLPEQTMSMPNPTFNFQYIRNDRIF